MSRKLSVRIWGVALAALGVFIAVPAFAAAPGGGHGSESAHIVLVRGGGGGGGGHGGGGFSGGGGGFSGGGHSFSGGSAHAFSGASPSFSSGAHSFSGGAGSFAHSNGSWNHGGIGHDGYGYGGWNHGNWAWHGNGYYGGWWGWGYPLAGWLGGYGWWYPGYYYGYGDSPYSYYYGDGYANGYASDDIASQQPYTALRPETQPQNNQTAEEGQGGQFLDDAVQAFQSGNYQNAMRLGEHAIVDAPRDTEAHEIVALAAFANKDYRTAATEAHAVIALGGVPSWSQVYALYQNADTYTSQLRSLEDYVKANPKSAEGQFLLGVQYLTTGYASDAHEHLAVAAQLAPKDKLLQEMIKGTNGEAPSATILPPPPTK